jgi:hypothetical protein
MAGLRGISGVPSDHMAKDPTVWMKALRFHTYLGRPINEGDCYLAHEEMVETIETALKFAVRIDPPKRAVRPPQTNT